MNDTSTINKTPKQVIQHTLFAALGLILFGVGLHFSIRANIGVAPWDALCLGLSQTFGVQYGTASISIACTLIIVDLILKEKIGIGTFLDAFIVGKTVDFCNKINLVPQMQSLPCGLLSMFIGMVIMGFSQFIYMRTALGCGPRDSFLIALGKRFSRVPIGVVSIGMLSVVLLIGWLLGGPVGIGTLIAAFCIGPIMQFEFSLVKFNPTQVSHQNILSSIKVLRQIKIKN